MGFCFVEKAIFTEGGNEHLKMLLTFKKAIF